jgi:AraC-like DNA-binding protein
MTAEQPMAALGWLPTSGRGGQPLLALPSDLFMVTVHCGGGAKPGDAQAEATMDVAVTLLRTRSERFSSRSAGELAFALLTPAGLLALLRAPLEGVTNRRMSLGHYCRPGELSALRTALLDETDPGLRVRKLGAWIEERSRSRYRWAAQQQRVAEAAASIQHSEHGLNLEALRRALRVSPRQLERDFRHWLGVSPAAYGHIVRFQRAAMALASGSTPSETAAAHGYADQSHLSRAFRQLSSLTPRELARQAASPRRQAERQAVAGRLVVLELPNAERKAPAP